MNTYAHRAHRLDTGFPFMSILNGLKRFFTTVNTALEARNDYTRLSSMTDADLARHGLKREELPMMIARKYF